MKISTLLSIVFAFSLTILNAQSFNNFQQYNTNNYPNTQPMSHSNKVMQSIVDPNTGMVSSQIPLPANWKIEGNKIVGPGVEAADYPGGQFSEMQGGIYSLDQILNGQLIPQLTQQGAKLLNSFDIPELAQKDQHTYAQYWKAFPTQTQHQVKGLEFKAADGKPALVIVHYTLSRSAYGSFAFYYMNALEAEPNAYQQAKQDLIYALVNQKQNPQYLAMYNQREQQKSQASWNAHNQRINQNQANFDAWQKTQQTLSEVSDIQYQGWQKRNQIQDAGHQKTINGIWEQESRTNPYSGQQMNTSIHYKHYYMNQNGQVFGTNDPNYNPSQDPNMNHMNWKKVQNPGGY